MKTADNKRLRETFLYNDYLIYHSVNYRPLYDVSNEMDGNMRERENKSVYSENFATVFIFVKCEVSQK